MESENKTIYALKTFYSAIDPTRKYGIVSTTKPNSSSVILVVANILSLKGLFSLESLQHIDEESLISLIGQYISDETHEDLSVSVQKVKDIRIEEILAANEQMQDVQKTDNDFSHKEEESDSSLNLLELLDFVVYTKEQFEQKNVQHLEDTNKYEVTPVKESTIDAQKETIGLLVGDNILMTAIKNKGEFYTLNVQDDAIESIWKKWGDAESDFDCDLNKIVNNQITPEDEKVIQPVEEIDVEIPPIEQLQEVHDEVIPVVHTDHVGDKVISADYSEHIMDKDDIPPSEQLQEIENNDSHFKQTDDVVGKADNHAAHFEQIEQVKEDSKIPLIEHTHVVMGADEAVEQPEHENDEVVAQAQSDHMTAEDVILPIKLIQPFDVIPAEQPEQTKHVMENEVTPNEHLQGAEDENITTEKLESVKNEGILTEQHENVKGEDVPAEQQEQDQVKDEDAPVEELARYKEEVNTRPDEKFEQTTDVIIPAEHSEPIVYEPEISHDEDSHEFQKEIIPVEQAEEVVSVEQAEEVVPFEQTGEGVPLEQAEEVVPLEQAGEVVPVEQAGEVVSVEHTEQVQNENKTAEQLEVNKEVETPVVEHPQEVSEEVMPVKKVDEAQEETIPVKPTDEITNEVTPEPNAKETEVAQKDDDVETQTKKDNTLNESGKENDESHKNNDLKKPHTRVSASKTTQDKKSWKVGYYL